MTARQGERPCFSGACRERRPGGFAQGAAPISSGALAMDIDANDSSDLALSPAPFGTELKVR